jgi:hypothetical protein
MASVRHPRLFSIVLSAQNQFLFIAPFQFSSELFILFSSHYEPFPIFSVRNNISDMAYTGNSACVEYFSGVVSPSSHPIACCICFLIGEPWRIRKKPQGNLLDDWQILLRRLRPS